MSSKSADSEINCFGNNEFIKEEFSHDSNVDLYGDMIATSPDDNNNEDKLLGSQSESPFHSVNNRRFFPVCIGNLTWWTTDQDIIDSLRTIEVTDVIEVKFFENRANGQSKGFCVVALGSETSVKMVMDKFDKKEIHGQKPQVMAYTKQNLNYFENLSRKNERHGHDDNSERRSQEREVQDRFCSIQNEKFKRKNDHFQAFVSQPRPLHPNIPQFLPQRPPPQYVPRHSQWISAPSAHVHQLSSQLIRPGLPPNAISAMPPRFQNIPPPYSNSLPPGNLRIPPSNTVRSSMPAVAPRQFLLSNLRGPTYEWEHPNVSQPPPFNIPPHIVPPTSRFPSSFQNPNQNAVSSASHVSYNNSSYFQGVISQPATSQLVDSYSKFSATESAACLSSKQESLPLSELESEEIMSRNKTVSSSALSRAVSDASSGDYSSAIETLVTAISLIKQSKISNDERCKILIGTLQDTLHSIESKSYGFRSKERPSSKEREHSCDRLSRKDKSSRRARSRSRNREYKDRGREKDRHHDIRYHDKDRNRDHEHRSNHH